MTPATDTQNATTEIVTVSLTEQQAAILMEAINKDIQTNVAKLNEIEKATGRQNKVGRARLDAAINAEDAIWDAVKVLYR